MKPIIVSRSDLRGGAARAAWRLHRALRISGVDSRMFVADKTSDDAYVIGPSTAFGRVFAGLRARTGGTIVKLQRGHHRVPRSVNALPSRVGARLHQCDADVVNLHWVCGEFLAIEEIGRIKKPLVWTLHDAWPIGGAEHYPEDIAAPRFAEAYSRASRPSHQSGLDLDAWTWQRKARSWKQPMHIVCPSQWLADLAHSSRLTRDWPIRVIPNVVPVDTFRPWPRNVARQAYNLPPDDPLILFGAVGGGADPRKGFDLLREALPLVAESIPEVHAVIFGQSEPIATDRSLPLPVHYVGALTDDIAIALLYSAADVVVVPSRIDNLPQIATEAQSCGVPVVAFRTGGLPDAVEDGESGLLAEPYSVAALAQAVTSVLKDDIRRRSMGARARKRAEALWSPAVVTSQYLAAFRDAVNQVAAF